MRRNSVFALAVIVLLCGCGASADAKENTETIPEDLKVAEMEVDQPFDYFSVPMEEVTSTLIAEVGYDPDYMKLLLRFRSNGALYSYDDIPESVYDGLMSAESIGSYFNSNIRNSYEYEKLEDGGNYEIKPLYDETTYDQASFILNTGTGKFHKKNCRFAKAKNVAYVSNSAGELENFGYEPCKTCEP